MGNYYWAYKNKKYYVSTLKLYADNLYSLDER